MTPLPEDPVHITFVVEAGGFWESKGFGHIPWQDCLGRQTAPAFHAPSFQHPASCLGLHAVAKAVFFLSFPVVRLKCSLHIGLRSRDFGS
jgi:hypothetical protein